MFVNSERELLFANLRIVFTTNLVLDRNFLIRSSIFTARERSPLRLRRRAVHFVLHDASARPLGLGGYHPGAASFAASSSGLLHWLRLLLGAYTPGVK